jgi:imidazolonepropionase-like amidohydrolase
LQLRKRDLSRANKIVVHAAKLLDAKTGTTLSDQVVVIEGETIAAVGSAKSVRVDADAEQIELPNVTVLPRLIDCHVHLTSDPNQLDLGTAGLHISYTRRTLIGARNARITLEAGFTTVRNVAADGYMDVALRDAINAGDVTGPRMLVSGPALSITGGYWDENYLAPQFTFSKDAVAAVMKQVRENVKYGADLIKVMATGGVVSEGDHPAQALYSPEELKAMVETAHGLGRKVAAHAHASLGIKYAIMAGVDSIEHGSYMTDSQHDGKGEARDTDCTYEPLSRIQIGCESGSWHRRGCISPRFERA